MTQAIENKKPPYLLMYIVTLVYLVVTAFFEEGVAYFDPVYTTLMSSTEFYLTFSICVVLFLSVVFISRRYFKIKVDIFFFSIFLLLFLIDVVAVFTFPEFIELTGVYCVSLELKFRFITFWLAACMAFYVFFAIMPKSVSNVNHWNLYFIGCLFIAFVSCVYSYIKEPLVYQSFFDKSVDFSKYTAPISFTNNRNTYGTLLMMGVFSAFYLSRQTRKPLYLLFGLFIYVNMLFTLSKTAIICTFFFMLAFVIESFVIAIRSRSILRCIICLASLLVFSFPFFVKTITGVTNNGLLVKLASYLSDLVNLENPNSFSSLEERADIWALILKLLFENPRFVLFGFGDWNFSWYLGFSRNTSFAYIESAHSGFFDVFGRLGVLGLLIYLTLIAYFIYALAKNLKCGKKESFFSLFLLLSTIAHGMFEDTNFLNMQAKDMMFLFMTFMPVLTNYQLAKDYRSDQNWAREYASSAKARPNSKRLTSLQTIQLSFSILVPIYAVVIGLSGFYATWNKIYLLNEIQFQMQFFLPFLLLPLICYSSAFHRAEGNDSKFRVFMSLGLSWLISCIVVSLIVQNFLVFLGLLLSGLAIVFLSFIGVKRDGFKKMFSCYFVFTLIEVLLVFSNKAVISWQLIPDGIYQPYALMCLILLDLFIPFLIIVASPLHSLLLDSFDCAWARIELTYRFLGYRQQAKFEIKLMKATQRKPILRYQK
jgi:hypothetical protein